MCKVLGSAGLRDGCCGWITEKKDVLGSAREVGRCRAPKFSGAIRDLPFSAARTSIHPSVHAFPPPTQLPTHFVHHPFTHLFTE